MIGKMVSIILLFLLLLLLVGLTSTLAFSYQPKKIALNSSSIEDGREKVIIDFEECGPGEHRAVTPLASTEIKIIGKEGDFCQLEFGGGSRTPGMGGSLRTICQVPSSLGKTSFNKQEVNVDFSSINQYCRQKSTGEILLLEIKQRLLSVLAKIRSLF